MCSHQRYFMLQKKFVINLHKYRFFLLNKSMKEYEKPSPENAQLLLNPHIKGARQSATLEMNEISIQLQSEGRKIYRFGLGQSPFPVPEKVVQGLQEHAQEKDYLAVKGLKSLRHEIAEWLNRSEKLSFSWEDVFIGPGSKELLFIIGLTLNCDLVMPTPCWVSYIPQKQFLGKTNKFMHTKFENKWRLLPQELEKLCQQDANDPERKNKYMILNYPDNPTGLTYRPEELQELAKVARKHNMIIVSDQIYGKVDFDGKHESIAKYYPEGTIISSGISKWAGAGGWRLGFFAFPKELRWVLDSMSKIASDTFSAVSAPIQYASCIAFREGEEIQKYLEGERAILKRLAYWVFEKLTKDCDLLSHRPEGGFYIFLDFEKYRQKLLKKGIKFGNELTKTLLEETGVAVLPGEVFGREETQLTIRLSFVNFDGGEALKAYYEGVEVNEDFLKKHCADTVEGIEVLGKWLHDLS